MINFSLRLLFYSVGTVTAKLKAKRFLRHYFYLLLLEHTKLKGSEGHL